MFGPPKPFTSMFFPCPPARVFSTPTAGFSTPPAGFFHAYGRVFPRLLRVVHSASLNAHSQTKACGKVCGNTGPICGKSCGKTQAVCGKNCDKFADKLGFDQVSLETTRIDITFHNFFRNQPGCFHSFFRNQPGCFHNCFRNQPGCFHSFFRNQRMFPRCFKARR